MKYRCKICSFVYDDAKEKVPFDKLPDDWVCPVCKAPKSMFEPVEEANVNTKNVREVKVQKATSKAKKLETSEDDLHKLSISEFSALCSNLARGCEKQYKFEEMELFNALAQYFDQISPAEESASVKDLSKLIDNDINVGFKDIDKKAQTAGDRGALRVKTWSEKVTNMLASLLSQYETMGEKMFEGVDVWVCSICGFVYIGEKPPEICPVCKVPSWKFEKIEGRA